MRRRVLRFRRGEIGIGLMRENISRDKPGETGIGLLREKVRCGTGLECTLLTRPKSTTLRSRVAIRAGHTTSFMNNMRTRLALDVCVMHDAHNTSSVMSLLTYPWPFCKWLKRAVRRQNSTDAIGSLTNNNNFILA